MFFIILCCYKPNLDYLRIQIDSIRAQTDQNFHCLIQDDLSPPDIYEKVIALVAGDSRFSIRRNHLRLGVFHNFEQGLYYTPKEAQFICYCDQDDIWVPEKLAMQRQVFADPQVALCHSDLMIIDGQGQQLHPSCFESEGRNVDDYSVPQLILRNSVTGCTTAFRASLLAQTNLLPFPPQGRTPWYHHDLWTAIHALQVGLIHVIRQSLVRYRQHGGNVIGAVPSQRKLQLAFLSRLLGAANRAAFLQQVEREWLLRLNLGRLVLASAAPAPRAEAKLELLASWVQRPDGSARMLQFVAMAALRSSALTELGPYVLVGRLYHTAREQLQRYVETAIGRRLASLLALPPLAPLPDPFPAPTAGLLLAPLPVGVLRESETSTYAPPRFVLVLSGLLPAQLKAGGDAILRFAGELLRQGQALTILATEPQSGLSSEAACRQLLCQSWGLPLDLVEKVRLLSTATDVTGVVRQPLWLSAQDRFIATNYQSAQQVRETLRWLPFQHKQFIYYIHSGDQAGLSALRAGTAGGSEGGAVATHGLAILEDCIVVCDSPAQVPGLTVGGLVLAADEAVGLPRSDDSGLPQTLRKLPQPAHAEAPQAVDAAATGLPAGLVVQHLLRKLAAER
jgi:hypothetical protein